MIRPLKLFHFFLWVSILLGSCTGLKRISEDDPLYTGASIKFSESAPSIIRNSAKSTLQPTPNSTFLWMRPALARNTMLSDSAKQKKFWRNSLQDPVLLSQTDPDLVSRAISSRVFHHGYFNNYVDWDTIRNGKTVELRYSVQLGKPRIISRVFYPKKEDSLTADISSLRKNSLLIPGTRYSLETLKEERRRIESGLKDLGYIQFKDSHLEYRIDSTSQSDSLSIALVIKQDIPSDARISYKLRKIRIHDDFRLNNYAPDTLKIDNYSIISQDKRLRAQPLINGLFVAPDKTYSQSNHSRTVQYMSQLPLIRYATMKYFETDSAGYIDAGLYLTQRKRFAYTAEFNTIFRSTNYFGPGFVLSFKDRNLRAGSEELSLNLRGRFELQIADGVINPAVELGAEVQYDIPNAWPGIIRKFSRNNIPTTRIVVGYNYFNRLDLYLLNSLYLDFGYRWKSRKVYSHIFNPIEISYTSVPENSKSDAFREYLAQNPGVQRSFEDQLILGTGYDFTYNSGDLRKNYLYFNGGVDFSGNLASLLSNTFNSSRNSEGEYTLLGIPFSQYVRFRTDLRYEYQLSKGSSVATRFITGLGFPYGNSIVLPYIKQFFVGGTNSLRSFLARSVGPGSEAPPEGFTDLTGDMRLEANIEYRFSFTNRLKGALFMDAGNIWLVNTDPNRPNATFKWPGWINEVAVSVGWGLRWDFEYIVARLDFGYTLRTPYLPEGQRWAKEINFLDPTLNFAIGYPF